MRQKNRAKSMKKMQFSISNSRSLKWVLLIFLVFFFSPAKADPRTTQAGIRCGRRRNNRTTTSNVIFNFHEARDLITGDMHARGWGTTNASRFNPHIFMFSQCYGDLSESDCYNCFESAQETVRKCFPSSSARLYLDGCFLRYGTHNFYNETFDDHRDKVKCGSPLDIADDQYMKMAFVKKVRSVIADVMSKAWQNYGFAVVGDRGGVEGVYALAQCWKILRPDQCKRCLRVAGMKLLECAPAAGGKAMFTGCYLRYSTERFYNIDSETDLEEDESTRVWIIIAGLLSAMTLALVSILGMYLIYRRISNKRKDGCTSVSIHNSDKSFKYEILEKATEHFDPTRKLGQGGAGSVFKGILPDGKPIAVKRLFFNTRQWVDEFFNEVNLIKGIDHKNLVKLLGCSIEGPESLLVYEYVPNKSLDQILFDKKGAHVVLSWQERFDIISGIAEGLAHLHGGCGAKIVHRDIKTSNILLGKSLIPKIADFGLARSVASDRTHLSTGIAGTLGYMAPEYLVKGQLTEKADVYAFGVLVLEVLSGRKNSAFTLGSSSILHQIWKLYKENKAEEGVDPALAGCFPETEASKVFQIGFLCTQASMTLRPSMSEVVQMLRDKDCVIPSPKQPPFLNASVLNSDDSKINALALGGQGMDDVSNSSYASVSTIYQSFSKRTELF